MAYPVDRDLTRVSAFYRTPERPDHGGIDFAPLVPGALLPVYAVGAGEVVSLDLGGKDAGRNVMIRLEGDGSLWWYSHLSAIEVRPGQRLKDGQRLGRMGYTGNVRPAGPAGTHLHLERHAPRIDDETNPWPFIKDEPSPEEGLSMSDIKQILERLDRIERNQSTHGNALTWLKNRLGGSVKNENLTSLIWRVVNGGKG